MISKAATNDRRGSAPGRPPSRFQVDPNLEKKKARDPPTPSGNHFPAGTKGAAVLQNQVKLPTTLAKKDLERLKSAAVVITMDDRIEAQFKNENEIRKIEEEAEKQKQLFKQIDEAKMRGREGDKTDIFAEDRVKVLEASFIAKHEQEEEVKQVNRIMLNAKCHAIRDAQLQEKEELEKELKAEDNKLDMIMINRAKALLQKDDDDLIRTHEKKKKYAAEIKQQLLERENQRFLEAERIDEEAKIMAQANEALKRDDARRLREHHERREKLRAELNKICEMSNLFQKMLFEQEQEAERRIRAFMKDKEQREKTLALERKLAKQAFERKQQLLFDLQQKRLESASKREEMALLRDQENIEREFRRKEMEAAIRKKAVEQALHEARVNQLHEAKLREALQIAHNEDDFKKIVENLKREEEKQQKLFQERMRNRDRYRDDIIRQMNDKEYARRQKIEQDQADVFEWREQEKERERNVVMVIQSKLAAMREAHLPEKYIKDVEKQLKLIAEGKFGKD